MADKGVFWLDYDGCIAYCNDCGWQQDFGTRDIDAAVESRRHNCED